MKTISSKFPRFLNALRPTLSEIEYYARLIVAHEGRPVSALPDCRREAELQLWAERCCSRQDGPRIRRHAR